jgi:hypothetical protein
LRKLCAKASNGSGRGKARFVRVVNRIHLIYLGILPSLATLALLWRYGYPWPFLLFIGGVAMTGVYLVSVYHYTPLPSSVPGSLWVLFDGPLFALVARGGRNITLLSVIEGFLIDGLALWLTILALTLISSRPSPGQRVASLGIGCAVLGVILSLFWPYVSGVLWGSWSRIGWLVGGVVEGMIARYRLLRAEKALRLEGDESILYVALLVMLWVVAMSVGIVVHAR